MLSWSSTSSRSSTLYLTILTSSFESRHERRSYWVNGLTQIPPAFSRRALPPSRGIRRLVLSPFPLCLHSTPAFPGAFPTTKWKCSWTAPPHSWGSDSCTHRLRGRIKMVLEVGRSFRMSCPKAMEGLSMGTKSCSMHRATILSPFLIVKCDPFCMTLYSLCNWRTPATGPPLFVWHLFPAWFLSRVYVS